VFVSTLISVRTFCWKDVVTLSTKKMQ